MYEFEPHKAHCIDSNLNMPYRFNERFKVIAHPTEAWSVEGGVDLGPDIPRQYSKEYRSKFGPVFSSKTYMYACDNKGTAGCVRRLTCVRKPLIPGYHERLKANQDACPTYLGVLLLTWVGEMSRRIRHACTYLPDASDQRRKWTYSKHPKQKLRIRVENDIYFDGREGHPTRMKKVEYKCKPGELLAKDKYLRGVGDLTTPGSTKLGYFMDTVKDCFAEKYEIGRKYAQFVKVPDRGLLAEVFRNLIDPEDLAFYYFSDDACIGIRCDDGIFMANMDISACDGSNYNSVFNILWNVMRVDSRFNGDVDGAFFQCASPFTVRSMRDTLYRVVTFVPLFFVLYSGSVLTTSINNMANTLIFLSIVKNLEGRPRRVDDMGALIEQAAELVGYSVKIDRCSIPQHLQFLKHTPALVNGEIIPWLNIGVLCRGFGTFRGDLPGLKKMSWLDRAKVFNSDVVKSYAHSGVHIITNAFRKLVVSDSYARTFEQTIAKSVGGSDTYIPTDQIALRYGLNEVDVEELASYISGAKVGDWVGGRILERIFLKDYGLE